MGYSTCIGRVGVSAVALGVGLAVVGAGFSRESGSARGGCGAFGALGAGAGHLGTAQLDGPGRRRGPPVDVDATFAGTVTGC